MLSFLKSESGAVTTDWVVLTAAAIGLGGAAVVSVSDGVDGATGNIASALSNLHYSTGNSYFRNVVNASDFSNGPDGWANAPTREVNGFGLVLGPVGRSDGRELVHNTFDIPENTGHAKFEFDLHAFDTLDNSDGYGVEEGAVLYVNGIEVARASVGDFPDSRGFSFGGQNMTDWTFHDVSDVGVTVELVASGNLGGFNSHEAYGESTHRVQIIVDDPGSEVRMGFGVVANERYENESIAIDNFELRVPDPVEPSEPVS